MVRRDKGNGGGCDRKRVMDLVGSDLDHIFADKIE